MWRAPGFVLVWCLCVSGSVAAQPPPPLPFVLPSVARMPALEAAEAPVTIGAAQGYGFVEPPAPRAPAQHRVLTVVGVGVQPAPWLSSSLELSSTYGVAAGDDQWALDPVLRVRPTASATDWLRIGAEAALWVPSRLGGSLDFGASTVELSALATLVGGPWSGTVRAGYRLDRSDRVVDRPEQLSVPDRVALPASELDAVLLGLGGRVDLGAMDIGLEVTWEPAVGDGLDMAAWPLRLSPIVRWSTDDGVVTLFAETDVLLSEQPPLAGPIAPHEPWLRALAGVVFTLGAPATARSSTDALAESATGEPAAEPDPGGAAEDAVAADTADHPSDASDTTPDGADGSTGEAGTPTEPVGRVEGRVRGRGAARPRGTVRLEPGNRDVVPDADGAFGVDVPPGSYGVVVRAPGFRTQRLNVVVGDREVVILNVDLFPVR